jgi:hypothetical protein
MSVTLIIAGSLFGLAGLIVGFYLYYNEVLYPEKVIVKKQRQGGIETVYQVGKVVTDTNGVKSLYMSKEKFNKVLDENYHTGITTGFLGRKKRYWELSSPRVGEYNFIKTSLIGGDIANKVTSQSDRLVYQSKMKEIMYLTEKKKGLYDIIKELLPVAMPIIVVLAVIILFKGLEEQIINSFVEGANRAVGILVEGVKEVPNVAPPPA